MSEKLKSVLRHLLTALGTLVAALGFAEWGDFVDFIQSNFEAVWNAVLVVIGFITALIGFFKDGQRFEGRSE